MNPNIKRQVQMTRVNLHEIVPPELHINLDQFYFQLQEDEARANEQERAAQIAVADAAIARARAMQSSMKLLQFASTHSELVRREPHWLPPYTNQNGNIILASPMTQRDQRIAASAMHSQITRTPEQGDDPADGMDFNNLFGSNPE